MSPVPDDKRGSLSPMSRRAFFKSLGQQGLRVGALSALAACLGKAAGCGVFPGYVAYSDYADGGANCGYCNGACRDYEHCDGDYCNYTNYSDSASCAYSDYADRCGYCDGCGSDYEHCDGDYCDYINYVDLCI